MKEYTEQNTFSISRYKIFKKLMTLPDPYIARHLEYCKLLRELDYKEDKWLRSYYNRKSTKRIGRR